MSSIPLEMRLRAQWCVAGDDKAPRSLVDGRIMHVSVIEPSRWLEYEDARRIQFEYGFPHIGYVLTEDDPFTCIDLDVKGTETQEQLARFASIIEAMGSYAELSQSGRGVHVWVHGNIGKGVRRDGVEIYSQERFIICTGNVLRNVPIADRQEMLVAMVSQMSPRDNLAPPLVEKPQTEDDWFVLKRASQAENSDKFFALWSGRWQDWDNPKYPSQSEADDALINFLAFYSPNNEQVRRLFRASALGKREKALREDYVNRSLASIRKEQNEVEIVNVADIRATLDSLAEWQQYKAPEQVREVTDEIDWPPGFIGYMAQYMYSVAPRPVREAAIVAAIGLMAGICGKAWNISGTGLNLYTILVARSAIGKDAMYSGINSISNEASKKFKGFPQFICNMDMQSGEALMKNLQMYQSAVHMFGEIGHRLKKMANERNPAAQGLRSKLLEVFSKSGKDDIVGGMAYSDKSNNVIALKGVAYSIIGETTPVSFLNAISDSMVEDGLMSRFLVIEYKGDRNPPNEFKVPPPPELAGYIADIAAQANQFIINSFVYDVPQDLGAQELLQNFNLECDTFIRGNDDEYQRYMWNRAHLKALKVAALLAVAKNYIAPIIDRECAEYAIYLIKYSNRLVIERVQTGDGGTDDSSRINKLKSILKEYILDESSAAYHGKMRLKAKNIITWSYLVQRTCKIAMFKEHRFGATKALEATIATLVDTGDLSLVPRTELIELGTRGKAWYITLKPGDLQ